MIAGGSWTAKHVVLDLPAVHRDAYGQLYGSPCMVANIALRNWRFLYKLGISGGYWFEGMGCFAAVRKQPTFEDHRTGFTGGADGDGAVLPTGPAEPGAGGPRPHRNPSYAVPAIRAEITPTIDRDVRAVRLRCAPRRGGRYPGPLGPRVWQSAAGFLFQLGWPTGPARHSPPVQFRRIAFANTDLSGDPSHTTSITEAERAAGQLLDGALRGQSRVLAHKAGRRSSFSDYCEPPKLHLRWMQRRAAVRAPFARTPVHPRALILYFSLIRRELYLTAETRRG